MKNIILTIISLLTLNYCFSQNNIGIVTYKKQILEYLSEQEDFIKKTEKRPKHYNNVLTIDLNTKQLLKDVNFYLKFNKDEAIFEAENILEIENNNFYKIAISEGKGIFYNNISKIISEVQKDSYGELFLVSYPKINWHLINETKKIGKYFCYKAVTNKITNGRNGIVETPVTVWYAPELNIPFGPLGYGGLPGLILELEIYRVKYYADEINLNPSEKIYIKKPTQGKSVTKEEFDQIGNEIMQKLNKGRKF
jgi:GLPGLI family protein